MAAAPLRIDLSCPACRWAQECGEAEVVKRLRGVGMLKRNPQASADELRELIFAAAGRLTCTQCQHIGLLATTAPDEESFWPEAARCEICGQPIPAERLDVFPDARTCVNCQKAADQGCMPKEVEYCPKCGAVMVLRQSRGGGVTRYSMACSANPPCR